MATDDLVDDPGGGRATAMQAPTMAGIALAPIVSFNALTSGFLLIIAHL